MDLASYIRDIPDFPKPGILFKDITPLLAEPPAFQHAIDLLAEHYRPEPLDAVAAAEARGFLLAAPMALLMKVPLIPLRKPGKLPHRVHSLKYELEYGMAELQVHIDGVPAGAEVLMIDDLLATGGTALAAVSLVEQSGAQIVECAFVIELLDLPGRQRLEARGHAVHALCGFTETEN